MEYAGSYLELATTVYYTASNPTERVRSDVNTRVKKALEAAGIEIPYDYVNVVVRDEDGRK
jgi:small-conductance mechanosensitive channel